MHLVCLDLEGVLIPEIWVNVAERVGVKDLLLTTRDIADYDELMQHRLNVMNREGLGMKEVSEVIATLEPLEGAKAFMDDLRANHQVIILSDTFSQFAKPMMAQLDWPTVFCHELEIDAEDRIANYCLRQQDQKRKAVQAFHGLNYKVVAAGDSYNDTTMLSEADAGILFCPPDNVVAEFPQFPVTRDYAALREQIERAVAQF